jgi:hypothetical protein
MKPKEVTMPFEAKPLLPELESADVGDMVVFEEVTVIKELWRGGTDNGMSMTLTERGGREGVVKLFDGSVLPVGKVITAVGKKHKHAGKYSIEVKAGEGGGVALDGEPLATVEPPAQAQTLAVVPEVVQQAAPVGNAPFSTTTTTTSNGHEQLYLDLLEAFKSVLNEERPRVAATGTWLISLQQGKSTPAQIRNLISLLDVPF